MINLIQISLIIFVVYSGCLNTSITGTNNQEKEGKEIQLKTKDTNLFTDHASIVKAEIEEDMLLLTVEYGGGCKDHVFELYWDGLFMESYPLQVKLELSHNSNEDVCRALITEELAFDLSIIKSRFDGLGQKIIIVNISEPGASDAKHRLDYRFEL